MMHREYVLLQGNVLKYKQLHTSIKGVYGTQTTGGNIVSFNLTHFRLYGKKQGLNAPVGVGGGICIYDSFKYITS